MTKLDNMVDVEIRDTWLQKILTENKDGIFYKAFGQEINRRRIIEIYSICPKLYDDLGISHILGNVINIM